MKRGFLVLLIIIFLLPFLAIAHTTYLISYEDINVTIKEGSANGKVSGDISGIVNIDNYFSLKINSGEFAGYEFGFTNWEIGDIYSGISTWFYDPESDETHIAIGGDIAAIGHSISDGMAKFDLARIGDTQRYGNFIYEETDSEFISYNKNIRLYSDIEHHYVYGTGYYNGEIEAQGVELEFYDPNTDEELEATLFVYFCDLGEGEGFMIELSEETGYWELGGISPPLYGVIGDIVGDGKDVLIEHAAPLEHTVPLPSTLYLLGSGLFGILVIRRRGKHS